MSISTFPIIPEHIIDTLIEHYADDDDDEPDAANLLIDWWNTTAAPDRKGADHLEIYQQLKSGAWRPIAWCGDDRPANDFDGFGSSAVWRIYLVEFRCEVAEGDDQACLDMSGRKVMSHSGPAGAACGWSGAFANTFAHRAWDQSTRDEA